MLSTLSLLYLFPMITLLNLMKNNKKFLMSLLSLEMITLSLILFILLNMYFYNSINLVLLIMILTFSACEASIGLSLLVIMSRSMGSDKLNFLNMMKC
nr:TPA: NADH dehydrogenase subunit 4l [Bdellodrilus illuminatus]